ncbi:MAG: ABC transporter ATP-binding protein/permease [Lachnospiraceae bacterium]|nr:ABC transporter ATP-binding protein/permease [Lachnospiraceae bacterium]
MLRLKNIVKEYDVGDEKVPALKGVSLEFRENEFVSILGPSGCGKTTLLNIIGGLDKYTSGDLIINGISTTQYKDRNWDSYRNHSIGFVFQSYNLIPHQSVLANVELALTLSGVSRKERRRRAVEALEKVGLKDQIKKKPNQLSGGQMQRVAIARALVNDPDILLADEPTGALDTATSAQIMDILAEIAEDKLVIMVTHNPELAQVYSTRIIKLLDGEIQSDSMPVTAEELKADEEKAEAFEKMTKQERKAMMPPKTSMSLMTALSLSLNNLMTKKARTLLTAFAGSIGIIGIALILSLSNGVQIYIDKVQEDTLSSYPITIEKSTIDMTSFMSSMAQNANEVTEHNDDRIYTNQIMTGFMEVMVNEVTTNNLKDFRQYIEANRAKFEELTTDIHYGYSTRMNIYKADIENGIYQVNPGQVFKMMGMGSSYARMSFVNTEVWQRLINNDKLLDQQYDVVYGRMPEKYNEVVLIVSGNNEVTDYTLYSIGVLDSEQLGETLGKMIRGEEAEWPEPQSYSYEELCGLKFKLMLNSDYYAKENGVWVDKSKDEIYMMNALEKAETISIVGILKSESEAAQNGLAGTIGYRTDLMEHLIDQVNNSEIVREQKANPDTDVFTGIKFEPEETVALTWDALNAYIMALPDEERTNTQASIQQMRDYGMSDEKILETLSSMFEQQTTDATYEDNLRLMGVSDPEDPSTINLYPKDFESKDALADLINEYNRDKEEDEKITYTDLVGLIMSSVSTIINAISYILIAFVAISLVVSSIMIGIITYISVLERTKEIGILRAIGASKKDISRVFNAETLIVGFTAGLLGILITFLLLIPINIVIKHFTDIAGLAVLPYIAAGILILISMLLTFIAGLFPSRIAAKKDPVVALRTE